ncbi:hypothetical protein, partial [Shigella sp. FC1180]|uniref:hypothetical protein n=1 Tax=Shigella sp. FC1180 TaxID=1890304 RepID=UPI000AEF9294
RCSLSPREQQNVFCTQCRQLEQANQALVAKTGAQEYAPHVINTPLAFLIKMFAISPRAAECFLYPMPPAGAGKSGVSGEDWR